jgi:hypothetical protein
MAIASLHNLPWETRVDGDYPPRAISILPFPQPILEGLDLPELIHCMLPFAPTFWFQIEGFLPLASP